MGSQRYEYIRNIERAYKRYLVSEAKMIEKEFNKAQKELEKEARKMYDSYIRQYYKYKTKKYRRHVTGLGTGTGWNLYRAKDFSIESFTYDKYDDFYTLEFDRANIDFDTNQMVGYNYEDVTPQEVFDLVMSGHRAYEGWDWSGKYKGKYFSYDGIMKDAFEEFNNKRVDLLRTICKNRVISKQEKLKSKFNEVMKYNIKKLEENGLL